MSTKRSIGRLLEHAVIEERERRPVAGLEAAYEITRTGLVWSIEEACWVGNDTSWPYLKVPYENRTVDLLLTEAVAASWLSPDDRCAIRSAFPGACEFRSPWPRELLDAEQCFQICAPAIAAVIQTANDDELSHWNRVAPSCGEAASDRAGGVHVVDQVVTNYKVVLIERKMALHKHRKTQAMHCHYLRLGDENYSFVAQGSQPWATRGDTVSFTYTVSKTGLRYVNRQTLTVRNAQGEPVVRNIRRTRSTPVETAVAQ